MMDSPSLCIEGGILREITGQARNRVYRADEILQAGGGVRMGTELNAETRRRRDAEKSIRASATLR